MATILYIEDYPAAALTMDFLLQEFGHDCVIAATGKDALDKYRSSRFDLVLLDNKLPDLTGAEVARAMRDIERELRRTPGILVSYSAGAPPVRDYDGAAIDGFELKSLSMADIEELLQRYLPVQARSQQQG